MIDKEIIKFFGNPGNIINKKIFKRADIEILNNSNVYRKKIRSISKSFISKLILKEFQIIRVYINISKITSKNKKQILLKNKKQLEKIILTKEKIPVNVTNKSNDKQSL